MRTEGLRTVITPWDYGIIEEFYEAGSTSRYSELYTQAGATPPDPEPEPTPVPPRDAPAITYTTPPTEPVSYAMVVTVTTTADTSGATCGATCSLRQALNDVSGFGQPRPALIAFDIPESDAGYDGALGVWKITVGSSLPTAEDGQVTIDATTQPGYDGSRPVVIVLRDSSSTIDLKLGVTQYDDHNIVRGLALQGVGIMLNGDDNIISHNWLGLTDDGTDIYYYNDDPNNRNNAIIEGAGGSGHNYLHHNVLAGSGTVAVDLEGNDNLIEENYVGTRGDGTIDTSFPEANICDQTVTTDNWLGGGGIDIAGYRNRVLNNTLVGLLIKGSATSTPPDAIDVGFGEYSLTSRASSPTPSSTASATASTSTAITGTATRTPSRAMSSPTASLRTSLAIRSRTNSIYSARRWSRSSTAPPSPASATIPAPTATSISTWMTTIRGRKPWHIWGGRRRMSMAIGISRCPGR
ncbi:MAG: CSLREA domain-containing protein [Chloroflexi bacterium]|jgi:CSLREA domain-containing protein|nr:CSLREA domain-containing protein [Chloroflexota bacterium]